MSIVYNANTIGAIPSLEKAHDRVSSNPKLTEFLDAFSRLAESHDERDRYGVTLVHRHTAVNKDQRLMDFGRTLQPIRMDNEAVDLHGHPIRPKSFAWINDKWSPYEYELGSGEGFNEEFFSGVQALLECYGFEDLGLRRYSPADPEEMEITEAGNVSVKVPHDFDADPAPDSKQTFWAYPSGSGPPKNYRCSCSNYGSKDNPNHQHIDQN